MKADISRFRTFSSRRSPHLRYPEWQAEYQAAIPELELNRLFDRVAEAEVRFSIAFRSWPGRVQQWQNLRPSTTRSPLCE